MTSFPVTITSELLEHADGRPVAYIDATGIVVFTYQQPDGTYLVEIHTRDPSGEQVRVLLDGVPLSDGAPAIRGACPASLLPQA